MSAEGAQASTGSLSAPEFTRWLERRVDEGVPAAAVRFGDGEARLLTLDPGDNAAMAAAIRKIEVQTGLHPTPAETLAVKELLDHAHRSADVLGIHTHERGLAGHMEWMTRLADLHAEYAAADGRPALLAHCMFGHQVFDDLPRLLAGRRVSVISCRDLKPTLEADWGVEDVAVYQVPSQLRTRDVDGAYEAAMHHLPIWPELHDRIEAELTVRERGEVFLVGAGLFGKDLCIRVRDLGGIALDMGSALDRLAGKVTRGPRRRAIDFHARGTPVGEIPERLRRLYEASGHDEKIQQAVEESLDAVRDSLAAWLTRPLTATYETLCFDTMEVEVGEGEAARSRTLHLGAGITPHGDRDVLGIWWDDGGGEEPTHRALADIRRRGLREFSVAREPIGACRAIRTAIETHGRFPDEQAAASFVYLALHRTDLKPGPHTSGPARARSRRRPWPNIT